MRHRSQKQQCHPDEEAESLQITGLNTEDSTINEGIVTYDIRFRAIVPGTGERISLIINVEAQNDFYPGYPIVKRNLYYCCRLVSSQYGTEFTNSHYEKIKKVYSIFICMNPPNYRKNTINQYSIQEENLIGEFGDNVEYYDLLTGIIICLGDAEDEMSWDTKASGSTIIIGEKSRKRREKSLQEEFEIKMTQELEREVSEMCNLSEGVEQKGIAKGITRFNTKSHGEYGMEYRAGDGCASDTDGREKWLSEYVEESKKMKSIIA